MKFKFSSVLQAILLTAIGLAILSFIWQKQSAMYEQDCLSSGLVDCNLWTKLKLDIEESSFFWIIVVSAIYLFSNFIRALRWKLLLNTLSKEVRFYNVLFSIMISYLCNLVVARSGEFVQVGLIAKFEEQKYEEVIGTLIFERIIDFIALLIFISLGIILSFSSLGEYLRTNIDQDFIANKLLILSILGIVGLVGLYVIFKVKIKGKTIKQRFSKLIDGLKRGLFSFSQLPNKALFIGYTAVLWSCYYLMMYGSFLIFDYSRTLRSADALMVSVCGSLGTILPTPGGVGGYHAMVIEGMTMLGVSSSEALSFAMITYFILNIICVVTFGVIALISIYIFNKW